MLLPMPARENKVSVEDKCPCGEPRVEYDLRGWCSVHRVRSCEREECDYITMLGSYEEGRFVPYQNPLNNFI